MKVRASLRVSLLRVTARRYRSILVASVITLLVSAVLLGLIGFTRWRGHLALQSDTHTVLTEASQQLLRSLRSRRGTLTFLRDTINRQPDLAAPALQAMGASAVEHTRHLLGVGLIRAGAPPEWWASPGRLSMSELDALNQAIVQRTQLRGIWRVPSTFVTTPKAQRRLLVMQEPLRPSVHPQSGIVGVFDLTPLLDDFFTANNAQHHPIQLLDGDLSLYHVGSWSTDTKDPMPIIEETSVAIDAERWTLQMQPGSTHVAQTLSWATVLLVALGAVAGLGVTIIVWILATRTWILQRAVERRTAALRRTTQRLRLMAVTDELTGLHNRRFFLNRWEWECARAKRYQRPLACLMIDVNGFKQVNDRLGHSAGDLVLKQVAQELKTMLRESDILARFGGDEFVIALPETGLAQATAVAEKLRSVAIPLNGGQERHVGPVSLSVGVGQIEPHHESPEQVLEAADQSLYAWKRRLKTTPALHS